MSELNVYHHELRHNEYDEFYLKYEADKVIADLEDKLREQTSITEEAWKLKGAYHTSYAEAVKELYEKNKELRHHKLKRCLGMAKWCESKVYHIRRTPLCDMSEHEYWQYENDFWQRWQKRWLELAEKFKEVK